ncbi:hypothetical protein SJI19_12040 [Acerihabitans sp. TG2]|uniref:hypothetical protein n=1 Tax=Acerihabitans sp. TG2 TaxID=3096008 RepID=UPI002B22465A|nr:hypothetical protein [Acerihabitans sp. TG2]MEA9391263.1 hypothetical protein [Acerihabitans sp. TG2]
MKVWASLLFLLLINSTASFAEQKSIIGRGTQGLSIIPLTLTNRGNNPLTCSVSTAHWYSVPLGDIQSGKTLHVTLWKNIDSGEIYLLNIHQDQMPVQSLWCGERGNAYNTRQQLTLPDRRGVAPGSISLQCHVQGDRVRCQNTVTPVG